MAADAKYDLLIKGGHVIDPRNGVNGKSDVAVKNGKIARVANRIDPAEAAKVIDVPGLYVTPGLIDIHVHVYHTKEPGGLSIVADHHMFRSGVTTVADTGTSGANHFLHFRNTVIDKSKVRIFAFVNVVKSGMIGPYEHDIREMDAELAAATVLAHPDVCVGIKTAHYWTSEPFDELHPPWLSVDRAIEASEICGKPVMVDFFPRPERTYPELLRKMRPGDIHTHVFAQQFPVLDDKKKPQKYMFDAAERGIVFDLGHGSASFWYRNAIRCFENGFYPHSISTDLHIGNINGPVFSMLTTMSKMLAIGMELEDVIRKSTAAPAEEIGHPELGSLSQGSDADIAVLRCGTGRFGFWDCARTKMIGTSRLTCAMTVRGGEIVYDEDGHHLPHWGETDESR